MMTDTYFQKAVLNAPLPMIIYAEDGEVLLLSKTWTSLSGYTVDDIPTIHEWVKKAYGQKDAFAKSYIDSLYTLNEKVEEGEYVIAAKDGSTRIWTFSTAPLDRLPDGRRLVMSIANDITERKQAERELQETAWRLYMVVERGGYGITVSDPGGYFEIFNSKMEEISGYTLDEANKSGDFSTLLYPDQKERAAALAALGEINERDEYRESETVIQARSGERKTLLVLTSLIRYKNKDMYLSVYRDITARKRMEEELLKLSRVVEQTPTMVMITDTEGNVEYVNPSFTRLTGYHAADVMGKSPGILKSDEMPAEEGRKLWESIRSGGEWRGEFHNRKKNGDLYWEYAVIFPVRNPGGTITHFIKLGEDITERKLLEQELRDSRDYLDEIINSVGDPLFVKDREHKWVLLNNAYCTFMGRMGAELIGMTDYDFFPIAQADLFWENDESVFETGKENISEEEFTDAAGATHTIVTKKTLYVDQKGEKFIVGIIRDITERKRLEKMKDEFVGVVSHELRTPLSITKEGINLLLDGVTGEINAQQRDILGTARENIDRLNRIINNLLDISKIEAGNVGIKKEPVDMKRLVRKVAVLFATKVRDKNLELKVTLPDKVMLIAADPDRITQVLTNLLDNAVKFTERGSIGVEARDIGREISCSIHDTGIGITLENIPKVFGKFQQFTRVPGGGERGTGLGLSIAKGIVEAHRGRIWVESAPGKGTTFTFTLPKEDEDTDG